MRFLYILLLSFIYLYPSYLEAMQRTVDSLTGEFFNPVDDRIVHYTISEKKCEKLSNLFAKIQPLISLGTECEEDFVEFKRVAEIDKDSTIEKRIFSVREKEGAFLEGKLSDSSPLSYMTTFGVHNCVALTLWGKNSETEDFFAALFHITRIDDVEQLSQITLLIERFSKYDDKRIYIHSGFRTSTLLKVYDMLIGHHLEVTSIYVNDAYRFINKDNVVNITYSPHYFGRISIDEIPTGLTYIELQSISIDSFLTNQKTSTVIFDIKNGRPVHVPIGFSRELISAPLYLSVAKFFVHLNRPISMDDSWIIHNLSENL